MTKIIIRLINICHEFAQTHDTLCVCTHTVCVMTLYKLMTHYAMTSCKFMTHMSVFFIQNQAHISICAFNCKLKVGMGTIFCENLIAVSFILMEILTRQFRHEFVGLVSRHENVGYERLCVCVRACLCTCVFLCAPQYEKSHFIVTFTPREENDVVGMIQIYEAHRVELQDFGQQISDAFMKNTKLILLPATGISESDNSHQPDDNEDYTMDTS